MAQKVRHSSRPLWVKRCKNLRK